MCRCVELVGDHARRVYDSKSRDDVRGAATVPGYGDVHVNADGDTVVLMTRKEADNVMRDFRMVEDALGGMARSRLQRWRIWKGHCFISRRIL